MFVRGVSGGVVADHGINRRPNDRILEVCDRKGLAEEMVETLEPTYHIEVLVARMR